MNGTQSKRAVYYGLLIVCLAAALLTLFLPYTVINNCYFYRGELLYSLGSIPISAFSYLHPGIIGHYLRDGYTNYDFVLLLSMVFGAVAVLFQLLSIRRVLEALRWEGYHIQQLSLGAGPIAGLTASGILLVISLLFPINQERIELPDPSLVPTVWPLFGILFHLCAMRLARVLNEERPAMGTDPTHS